MPWIDSIANGRPPLSTKQDSAPFHKFLKTQGLDGWREFSSSCHMLWPPNYLPELNPLDNYVWGGAG
ncbi:unnamed protein product [Hymenolepis diminuta]|uniref:Tc1-like transposase DDE domain-containing protein n=1 Tax=Hymenolepis diminuta TaxID=6216 RepID=A0A3P7BSC1_HYMDI|nr:unnamed protein product [Hymenolepis diminuta]